jgi:hypothetical protein
LAAPEKRSGNVAAELHGHIAVVGYREKHEPRAARPMDAKTAQREVAHDPPGDAHPDADPEPRAQGDATAAQRACRQ